MEHFSVEKWIDFARGVIGVAERDAMKKHLESGCKQCSRSVDLWKHVHQSAQNDRIAEPPDAVTRSIKGAFAIHGPGRRKAGARAVAQLLFDSLLSPAPAGVRSSTTAARQLMFGLGTYRVDLRLEPQFDSDKVALVGQVLHSLTPHEGMGEMPVALLKGRRVVAETTTTPFGEFSLQCDLAGPLHLRVKLPSEELQFTLVEPLLPSMVSMPLAYESKELSRILKRRQRRKKGT